MSAPECDTRTATYVPAAPSPLALCAGATQRTSCEDTYDALTDADTRACGPSSAVNWQTSWPPPVGAKLEPLTLRVVGRARSAYAK